MTAYGEQAEDALDYWRLHRDFEMALLTQERGLYLAQGLEDAFSLGAGQEGREIHIISGIA